MNHTEDKRKYSRKKPSGTLKVFDLNTDDYLGNVVDISLGGIMLVSRLNFELNSVYQFRIDISEDYGKHDPITFGGETLWTDDCTVPGKKWVGIQIIDISEQTADHIERLIDHHL